jgi:hypothetical protein
MKIRRVIRKRIDHRADGIQVAADINAVVSVNVNVNETNAQADRRKAKEAGARKPPR